MNVKLSCHHPVRNLLVLKYFLISQLLCLGKIISNWIIFLHSRLFLKKFMKLAKLRQGFPVTAFPPPVSLEAPAKASDAKDVSLLEGDKSVGSLLVQSCVFFKLHSFKDVVLVHLHQSCWYLSIETSGSIGYSPTRKRRFFGGSAIIHPHQNDEGAAFLWLPSFGVVTCHKPVGSWCFLPHEGRFF